jgi:hypothetical protein
MQSSTLGVPAGSGSFSYPSGASQSRTFGERPSNKSALGFGSESYVDEDEEFNDSNRSTNKFFSPSKKVRNLKFLHSAALNPLRGMDVQLKVPDYVMAFPMHEKALAIVMTNGFCIVIYICIVLFSIIMGVQLQTENEENSNAWFMLDMFFCMIFVAEVMLKFLAFGHNYFTFKTFVMEFCCTMAGMTDLFMRYKGIDETYKNTSNLLRCSRIVLLSKIFLLKEEFRVLILSFDKSVLSLSGVLFLLVVLCYGSTLVCYSVVGKAGDVYQKKLPTFDHHKYFGTIGRTMLTLFSVLIISDWEPIVRSVFKVQPFFVLFFIGFTVFVTFGIMNVVVGIIVDTVSLVHKGAVEFHEIQDREVSRERLMQIVEAYRSTMDADEHHKFKQDEFQEIAEIIEIVDGIDLPYHFTVDELYSLLDTTGHGQITQQQLVDGLLKLLYSNQFHRDCQLQLSLNCIRRDHVELKSQNREIAEYARRAAENSVMGVMGPLNSMSQGISAPYDRDDGDDSYPMRGSSRGSNRGGIKSGVVGSYGGGSVYAESGYGSNRRQAQRTGEYANDLQVSQPNPNLSVWGQLRASLQAAASKLCKQELKACWENLENSYHSIEPANRPRAGVMPSMTETGAKFAFEEENFFVWNKMASAVYRESLPDLRRAMEHAKGIAIVEEHLAILTTYRDVLARHTTQSTPGEVLEALESKDFARALEIVVDASLAHGADRHLLLNALVRLHTEAGNVPAWQEQAVMARSIGNGEPLNVQDVRLDVRAKTQRDAFRAVFAPGEAMPAEKEVTHLLAVLHSEAQTHTAQEVKKAWDELDKAYRNNPGVKGGFGPDYTPFSKQEEQFFIRNKMNNAVHQESLIDLRRAISHALTFGIDAATIELEVAYRDALARYHQSCGLSPRDVKDALDRGEWWTALDIVVSVAMFTGIDRQTLIALLGKVSTQTSV